LDRVEVVIDYGGRIASSGIAKQVTSVSLWQILGTGFDRVDLDYWRKKNIPLANTPGPTSGTALAECALMLMLMLARGWSENQVNLRKGVFYQPVGSELGNRHLAIVGLGASGIELARRARPFDMKISAIDIRDVSAEEKQELGLNFAGKPEDLDGLIKEVDYLSLHLHLNEETQHFIDAGRLALMKPTACLINVARGALVDEQALCAALSEGRLAGAGLDVFEMEPLDPASPLLKLTNVVATPHIAGVTRETSLRRAACCAENVDRIAAGLEPLYRVDK
jgi:phosphoglycerate dehydrogenase-like enzyme